MNAPKTLLAVLFALFAAASLPAQQTQRIDPKMLENAAKSGDADSQFEYGVRLVMGEGLKKNATEGAKWIEKAAKQKHRQAMHVMGTLYQDGLGVPKDIAKAHEWFEKGAAVGFAMSQHQLGAFYDEGTGVEKNPAKAAEWFRKAGEQGLPQAQTAYAAKLETGEGVAKNLAKAALWYLKAAKQEFVPAMTRLANLYYNGEGVPVDYRRARAWYLVAATSEDPWSSNNIAWFYATCPDDSMHNGEKAVELSRRALKLHTEILQAEEHPYEMVDTMAAALARNGEYKEAELWQKRSLSLLAEDKDISAADRKKLEDEFNTRLKLYQKQTPYTEPVKKSPEGAEPLPQDTILQDLGIPDEEPKKAPKKPGRGTVV